jgi:hypothetical protein
MFLLIGNGFTRPGNRPSCSLAFHTGVTLQIWHGQTWDAMPGRWETPAQLSLLA